MVIIFWEEKQGGSDILEKLESSVSNYSPEEMC